LRNKNNYDKIKLIKRNRAVFLIIELRNI